MPLRSAVRVQLALVLIPLAAGCGGGSSGGSPTAPPTPAPSPIRFSPAAAAGAESVYLDLGATSGDAAFSLEVRVSQVEDLYGVGLDLIYPVGLLDWIESESTEGSFLDAGGEVATEFLVAEMVPGTLLVGISRLGEVTGVSGSDLLFTLRFNTRTSGSGAFELSSGEAFDSQGERLEQVSFVGGAISINN